jgi:hypothetical protein
VERFGYSIVHLERYVVKVPLLYPCLGEYLRETRR